jgi:hypothetical protein
MPQQRDAQIQSLIDFLDSIFTDQSNPLKLRMDAAKQLSELRLKTQPSLAKETPAPVHERFPADRFMKYPALRKAAEDYQMELAKIRRAELTAGLQLDAERPNDAVPAE